MTKGLAELLAFMNHVRVIEDELDADTFKYVEDELSVYYQQHAVRFLKTLHLLETAFTRRTRLRILEIGAAPYFLTAYLIDQWGWDIVPVSVKAGAFPGVSDRIMSRRILLGVEEHTIEIAVSVFNVERDSFPFDAGTFDGILCLETIEHLGYSPSHMLAECHRVLKPDGILVITTPNSLNLLDTVRLLLNRTIAMPYSGYGFYGRHQREFTAEELRCLLEACHFQITYLNLTNISHPFNKRWWSRFSYAILNGLTELPLPYFRSKRDHIFLLARPMGEPFAAYPASLYVFRHLYSPELSGGGQA